MIQGGDFVKGDGTGSESHPGSVAHGSRGNHSFVFLGCFGTQRVVGPGPGVMFWVFGHFELEMAPPPLYVLEEVKT